MKQAIIILFTTLLFFACSDAQTITEPQLVGGPCEGCEAVLEYENQPLTATTMLPDFHKEGTQIKIKGTVYQNDGRTPAKDVILYIYHTNQAGIYEPAENATGWARRHGYNRAWLKTDEHGQYAYSTLKPAIYPNRAAPAHIHYTVLEPNGKYYWIEDVYFDGDSLLTDREMQPAAPRGGVLGVLSLKKEGELLVGTKDIVLGKNVPNYE